MLNASNLEQLANRNWSMLIYKNDSLIQWTKSIPHVEQNKLEKDSLFITENNGTFQAIYKQLLIKNNATYSFVGVFPIYSNYDDIKSSFLISHFAFTHNQNLVQEDFGFKLEKLNKVRYDLKDLH